MIKIDLTPVVGNYDSFTQAKFDYGPTTLIPIFEIEIENVPDDEYIKNGIDWSIKQSTNNSLRIPTFQAVTNDDDKLNLLVNEISDEAIFKMFDELDGVNKRIFSGYYGYDTSKPSSEFFKRNLNINKDILKDNNINVFPPHFDGRNTFGTIIINLTDNETATQFFDYRDKNKLIYTAPTQKGKGVFWINCETTFHGYGIDINNIQSSTGLVRNDFRYALLANITLKII